MLCDLAREILTTGASPSLIQLFPSFMMCAQFSVLGGLLLLPTTSAAVALGLPDASARAVAVSVPNIRDLGGIGCADGRAVRTGKPGGNNLPINQATTV